MPAWPSAAALRASRPARGTSDAVIDFAVRHIDMLFLPEELWCIIHGAKT